VVIFNNIKNIIKPDKRVLQDKIKKMRKIEEEKVKMELEKKTKTRSKIKDKDNEND
jgi:hypothetical protein